MARIIGICGYIGSGKDTIADYLVNKYSFRRDSFAATLKDAVGVVFGWDRDLLEGKTKESRIWREQVDSWWANRLNIPDLTPRWVLQYWGTEVCRHGFHDDIWIASLENKFRHSVNDIVISDCRFPNEMMSIKSQCGITIWVDRGTKPDWYADAIIANTSESEDKAEIAKIVLAAKNVHASEYSIVGRHYDYTVDNNGSYQDLYDQIDKILIIEDARSIIPAH